MRFYKMHGAGNDYIYFDCMHREIENPEKLSIRLSDRHFSIGGDGIILLCPSDKADVKMRMFNADGSEGKMCGNGIRSLGKLAHMLGYVKGNTCRVETLSGIKTLQYIFWKGGKVESVKVDMDEPELNGEKIPSTFKGERVVSAPMTVGGIEYKITLVSMGNPHCVVFTDPDTLDIGKVGILFENAPEFPDGINTEFVKVTGENELKMRVWERGSGETLACGTGACAAAVAAVLNGLCRADKPITVHLSGGDLTIEISDDRVYMTGGATLVFTGEVDL
ncbi:MAG: diaminopimelate epimerase [Clostridia bacterium]|nr:diaminopimelate epimerase [Clostridia bacterium]